MKREEVFNYAAGPSVLPTQVLETAAAELVNYRGTGMSVMEMSHRSKVYLDIFNETKQKFREALHVPDSHEILFQQGGGSLQFSMIPLNFSAAGDSVDYAVTGRFAGIAADEAERYCTVRRVYDGSAANFAHIPTQQELDLDPQAKYFYYCSNNTVMGTSWKYVPDTHGVPIMCDMSSEILSHGVDVAKYGLIFAGAQKNMAPAGLTMVIVDRALCGYERDITPLMLSYQRQINKDSMYNTPPCYNIYLLGLVLDWLKTMGGVEGMEKFKHERAAIVYNYLNESKLFKGCADEASRSDMNVTFRTGDKALDAEFAAFAQERGLLNLKGHRSVGGMRASLYNAMPMEGAVKLVEVMKEFEASHV